MLMLVARSDAANDAEILVLRPSRWYLRDCDIAGSPWRGSADSEHSPAVHGQVAVTGAQGDGVVSDEEKAPVKASGGTGKASVSESLLTCRNA
jgi:hypothetical protein